MSRESAYRLLDEPRPGRLARMAVEPLWPLLSMMLAGSWLGLPWFVFNSLAVGSPTRKREILVALLCLVGSLVLAAGLIYLVEARWLPVGAPLQYALLSLTVWKLAMAYWLFSLQSGTVEIYRYYGGELSRFGILVLLAGAFVVREPLLTLLHFPLWVLIAR
ncbi:MAG: hypothetical protein GAK43_01419 [Stenotrophomonas maltophilia]|nr:MAG: hypothetical protein GAK43_01419 [Stenotrophomonas maltophilia]